MPYGHRKKTGKLHSDDWRKWPREAKERLFAQYQAEEAVERAKELESQGWRAWYTEIFGAHFTHNLAPHHCEAIEWHWQAIMDQRAGLTVPKTTYPAIWSRGHRKSNIVRAMVVADACLRAPGYCLYVSCTKGKVRGHAISVEALATSAKVREYYPKVGEVKRNVQGASKGWTADFMYSDANYSFHFIGLEQGVAGANVEDVRPSLIVLDDVDDREDSALISDNRLHVLTRAVLPTRQANTLVFLAQNYISRHGCIYRIHSGKERVLTNRVITKPIPAIVGLRTEPQLLSDGIIHDVIIGGTPTWDWYDKQRAQEEIDTIGLRAFVAECQHDVESDLADLILPEYSEKVHIVNWEDFNRVYGLHPDNRECPPHWQRYVGHDWGASEGHACCVLVFAVAAQNSLYPGTVFVEKLFSFGPGTLAGTVAHTLLNWVLRHSQSDPRRYIELGLLDRAVGDPADLLAKGARTRVMEELSELSRSYCMWHMGHDHKAVRDIYRMLYALPFQPCVDEGEVLTQHGWVQIQDVQVGDYVYSADLNGLLSLKRVVDIQCNWYEGDMIRVHSKGLYQSFTPDHQLLFRNDNKGQCKEKWRLLAWNENQNKTVDVIRAPLSYEADGDWEVPLNCVSKEQFLAFLGIWLAEGCVDARGNGVRITQCDEQKQPAVKEMLDQLPWSFRLHGNGDFVTSDESLHHYLGKFGKAHQKFVPREILQHATTAELAILFRWLMFGDGAQDGYCYYSTSETLANDLSEIALKLGWKVYQRQHTCHCVPSNPNHRLQWIVNLSRSRFPSTKVAKVGAAARLNSFTEPYAGLVYDLTVEDNHTFVIRQKGRVWISGNCNPKRDGGVYQIRQHLRTDTTAEHPFTPNAYGVSRFYALCAPDQVKVPRNDDGLKLLRDQFPEWRWRPATVTANGVLDERPMKQFDDVGNAAMMIFTHFSVAARPLSQQELLTAAIPEQYRYNTLLADSPFEHGLTPEQELTHLLAIRRARQAGRSNIQRFDDYGAPIRSN